MNFSAKSPIYELTKVAKSIIWPKTTQFISSHYVKTIPRWTNKFSGKATRAQHGTPSESLQIKWYSAGSHRIRWNQFTLRSADSTKAAQTARWKQNSQFFRIIRQDRDQEAPVMETGSCRGRSSWARYGQKFCWREAVGGWRKPHSTPR